MKGYNSDYGGGGKSSGSSSLINGKDYNAAGSSEVGKEVISFCEFYQETTEVETVDELIKVERNGNTVLQMLGSITEKDIWIY